jgi:ligand-binding SRPBCC domain-containing protein
MLPDLLPPSYCVRVDGGADDALVPGARVRVRARVRGIPVHWLSFVMDMSEPAFIGFSWIRGPLRSFYHDFRLAPDGSGTLVREYFQIEMPFRSLGRWIGRRIVVPWLDRLCAERDRRLIAMFRDDISAPEPPGVSLTGPQPAKP